jgi:fluoroquinolone resistance protein
MERDYFDEQDFSNMNFTEKPLPVGDYENCRFNNCNFQHTDLSGIGFTDCVFTDCNLGMVKLVKTAFRNIRFHNCKLLGLHFEDCNSFLFAVAFDDCMLQLASFYQMSIKNTVFKHVNLREADFTEADLTGAIFEDCDLANAIFDHTVLEKADLRGAVNYTIDPAQNRIRKAKFSTSGIAGLLYKYDIEIN